MTWEETNQPDPAAGDRSPETADVQPVPTENGTNANGQESPKPMTDESTLSHALAKDDHEEKGLAQHGPDSRDVHDVGWNDKRNLEEPLIGGIDNEEFWMLVRRFNQQIRHVKTVENADPGTLDLNISDQEEFSPDKLRANIERLYMTVITGLLAAVKHVTRLRSWRERWRTACFCTAYFIAWMFDFLVPLFLLTLIILITVPKSRQILFPPAPIALVDTKTGGVQKPKSGTLGSYDSTTGAPENHKGEAVEQEARNFVNGINSAVLVTATGKHPQDEPKQGESALSGAVPDPTALAVKAADAKTRADGSKPNTEYDKTKASTEQMIWTKMRPIMRGIEDAADIWERCANALSPIPPFPANKYRLRLAALIAPLCGISLFVTSYMFMKGVTFGIGFGLFGDPIIQRLLAWLNKKQPEEEDTPHSTIMNDVPTNAQLTITLLRIGEASRTPLPPPPRIDEAPPEHSADVTKENLRAERPLNVTDGELDTTVGHAPQTNNETGDPDIDSTKKEKHGKVGSKIVGLFRVMTRGVVNAGIGADSVRATTGSRPAKDRLGVVYPLGAKAACGPVSFKARYEGKKGQVYITTRATIPCLAFCPDRAAEKVSLEEKADLHPVWSVAVADITELNKIGGYEWKTELVVGWSLDTEVRDDLEIKTRQGETYKITALPQRDELFNRLVAMGGQRWEAL